MKNVLIFVILLSLLTSCADDIQVFEHEVENFEPALSLSGYVCPDSIYACLTQTKKRQFHSINGPDVYDATLTDSTAIVSIYENGVFFCTLNLKSESYKITYNYEQDDTTVIHNYYVAYKQVTTGKYYTIKVEHQTFGTIEATTKMPEIPVIALDSISVLTNVSIKINSDYDGTYLDTTLWITKFRFTINDNKDEKNFYDFYISPKNHRYFYNYNDGFQFSDVVIEYDPRKSGLNSYSGYLFTDSYFNGSVYDLHFEYYKNCVDSVSVQLNSMSEDFYLYYLSLGEFWMAQGDPFSKPVTVYSNTSNHIGIWGAFARQTANSY